MRRFILTAGGTGGHIFPALSVAKTLREVEKDVDLLWVGTERSREREVCETNNIPIMMLNVIGINRRNPISAISAILKMLLAVLKVYKEFGKNRPDAVIAFGGYVCMPVLLAAKLRKITSFIQEQNSVPGLVNRLMSGNSKRTFLGLPLAQGSSLKGDTLLTGNPVRNREGDYRTIINTLNLGTDKRTILICGGSQGAASMNRTLVDAVKRLNHDGFQIIWQTGTASYEEIKDSVKELNSIWVYETLKDLYPYYSIADVLVGRSGASTLAEAALFGLPAVMIPLPWSAEDHQRKNAMLIQEQGWGVVVAQDDNCSEAIYAEVKKIMDNDTVRENMKKAALGNSPEKAAFKIATEVLTGSDN